MRRGAEGTQNALAVGEVLEDRGGLLVQIAGMEMQLVVLDVEDVSGDAVAVLVARLSGQFLEELCVGNVALGYAQMAGFRGRDHRSEAVGPCDLFGDLGIEDAGRGLLPDLLVLLPGQLETFVVGLDANGRVAVFREVVVDVLDDGFFPRREVADISETGDDLVAFLEQGIVDELEVPVGDRQLQDVEFLFVVFEDERGDLLRDVRREGLPLDLDQKGRFEGVDIHAPVSSGTA
ncbi:hypothetical protein PITCH_A230072 [uncultured Desulfobacterium sp.]|uniref:Uncharacterized protein n=1 Tax=uncultured Desulfobacterium sp. TaxID=201089 RepID=A0A445MY26_9BACT|nr:hypothetical protein PITCH_A230072 [uncultured Desulfobacterium sp.]